MKEEQRQLDKEARAREVYEKSRENIVPWRETPLKERLTYLKNIKKLMIQDLDMWVNLLSDTNTKTQTDALTSEIMTVLSYLKFLEKHAISLLKPRKEKTPIYAWGESAIVYQVPYGTVLIFSPWNFPLQLSLIPAFSALIAGNVVILKPSEFVSASLIATLQELFHQSGLPDGVLQIVEGGPEMGQALLAERPDKLFFTGGTQTGKRVYETAAQLLIPCELELGGKDALVVLEDAPIERAARAAVWGCFFNLGQVCISIERVFVHESVKMSFIKHVKALTEELLVGRDLPHRLNSGVQTRWIEQVDEAKEKGAICVSGDWTMDPVRPLILTDVSYEMALMNEETFGPVMPIMSFTTDEEAAQLVNASSYGLSASIFSLSKPRAHRLAQQLEVGNCFINNVVTNVSYMRLPFGGRKQSGFGISHGKEGLLAFSRPYSVTRNKGHRKKEANWFPYNDQNLTFLKRVARFLFK